MFVFVIVIASFRPYPCRQASQGDCADCDERYPVPECAVLAA